MEPSKAPAPFLKPYNPGEQEARILELWEKSGYANPDTMIEKGLTRPDAESYSIVLPPPNVTGTLHMGHAAMLAIEDILIRYHRMRGYKTLWVPGTDSAAIATQSKVEEIIYKAEKKTRHDIGRDELMKRIDAFTDESKATIIDQVRRMGSSLDWSRYAYTMDESRYAAVMEAFKRMYEAGLIYRGNRIVNWDPKMQTTVSDDEIEHVEQKDPFYYFQYGPFVIGTVRPETKFGDKYVVMHPEDERYADYTHGQTIELEWINGPITATVIKDEAADREVGTGVMTITPAHSGIDFEIAQRHKLDVEQIIDERGILLPVAGEFAGQHIKKARPVVVERLREKGLLVKTDENYVHNISTNSRGGGTIEPQIKLQWFIDVNKEFAIPKSNIPGIESGSTTTLKKMMRAAIESGATKIAPERFEKIYFHWIDNLRDWCISRQIWFGHRIPVWYDMSNSKNSEGILHYRSGEMYELLGSENTIFAAWAVREMNAGKPIPMWAEFQGVRIINFAMASLLHDEKGLGWDEIKKGAELKTQNLSGGTEIVTTENDWAHSALIQDPDTLDTWFSSGLWTFSTLGWPNDTADLRTYHPTAVLETGYDILFFWVARMVLMSGFLLGDVPFRRVYLHGLVRDDKGRKMSKSLGNIIDPLTMIDKFGADAARLSLIIGAQMGNDLKLSEDRVRGYKHFANKLWNVTRFVLENPLEQEPVTLTEEDETLVTEARDIAAQVSKNIDSFRLDLAGDMVYHFVWDRFAAEILEASKPIFKGEDARAKASRAQALNTILNISLKLLHPFMPFVTEAIWQELPQKDAELLMVAKWPV